MSKIRRTGIAAPTSIPAPLATPGQLFDGTIGGKHVQIAGNPNAAPMSQSDAVSSLLQSNQQAIAAGALDPTFWKSLNPSATAADLAAYKKLNATYRASTEGQQMGDKITNAIKFEVDRASNLVKNVANNPTQALTGGIDPIGTKIGNALTGADNKPLVGQLGGATQDDFNRYEAANGFGSLGAARNFSTAADAIAAIGGAAGAAHGIGQAVHGLTGATDSGVPMQTVRQGANLDSVVSQVPGAAAAGAEEALPEIVVTGTAPSAGAGLGQVLAGAGAAAGGAAAAAGSGGGGTDGSDAPQQPSKPASNNPLSSLFGGNMTWQDLLGGALDLYGAYNSAQGNAQNRDSLNNARVTTELGASGLTGPGGSSANVLANGAGGNINLGDMEGMRAFLSQLGTQSSQNALTGGLPDNIKQALAGVQGAAGLPGAPDTMNLQGQLDSVLGRSMNDMNRGSVAPGLQSTAFTGAAQQLGDASRGFGDVRDSTLANLRAQAKPEEDRAFDNLQNNLFATGRLGSSGGALQTEAFARGLGQADLSRQLSANQEARTTQSNALNIGTGLAGVGSNVAGLDDQLLQSAFQRFGTTAGLSSDLTQQRFGNATLQNNTGYDRANTNLGNQINAAQLPTALQGNQLQLALQALTGQGSLQNQGLAQFQAALAAATSGANARIGAGSVNAQLAGQASQIPTSADTWGQVLTGIAGRMGNNGSSSGIGNILSGLFGGNKSTQPVPNNYPGMG